MSTPLPLDFPGLQTEAQRLSNEIEQVAPGFHCGPPTPAMVRRHALLLANLDRAESRDRWAWLMAAHMGWKVAEMTTAPMFFFEPARERTEDSEGQPASWCLAGQGFEVADWFGGSDADDAYAHDFTAHVPGLPLDPEQRIEAFRLVLHATFGVAP